MEVQFREFNPFDIWIWLELENYPSPMEQQYIEELFTSWFYLGKLGGFNGENLQIQEQGIDLSYLEYDQERLDHVLMAPMHNMGDFQYLETWARCWFDLGTSDLIGIDILINALTQLSQEYVPIKQVIFGGENEDWAIDDRRQSQFFE